LSLKFYHAAHKLIWNDLHILHQDISINNLLLRRLSSTELTTGLLIDFDYAQHITTLKSKGIINTNSPTTSPPTTSTFAARSSCESSTSSVIGTSTVSGSHNITKDIHADSNVVPNTNMVYKNDSKGSKGVAENLHTVSFISYLDMGSSG
jgi:hypothetical protein